MQVRDGERTAVRRDDFRHRLWIVLHRIVDHDHLEPVSANCLALESFEGAPQRLAPLVGGDDDRDLDVSAGSAEENVSPHASARWRSTAALNTGSVCRGAVSAPPARR